MYAIRTVGWEKSMDAILIGRGEGYLGTEDE